MENRSQTVTDVLEKAEKDIRTQAKYVKNRTEETIDDAMDWAKRHPLQAAGTAVAAGAAIGALVMALAQRRTSPYERFRRSVVDGQERWGDIREAILEGVSELRNTFQAVRSALR